MRFLRGSVKIEVMLIVYGLWPLDFPEHAQVLQYVTLTLRKDMRAQLRAC